MTSSPPLTRYVGTAERTLQALLETELGRAGLSFPEWTVLTFLNSAGALAREQLAAALASGLIAGRKEADALIGAMIGKGLIAAGDGGLSIAVAGAEIYLPVRKAVESITTGLTEGIPEVDLATTRRTLEALTRRAAALLPAEAA